MMLATLVIFLLLAICCFASGWHFRKNNTRTCAQKGLASQEGNVQKDLTIFTAPLYVLNVERRTDRRDEMTRQVSEHPHVVWIKSVDGKRLINEQLYPDCKMSPGQIACFMSHALAWESLMKSPSRFGVVVEDDVLITFPFDFVRLNLVLQAVEQVAGQSWDIISVGYLNDYAGFYEKLGIAAGAGLEVARLKPGHLMPSGMCYLVTAHAARILLKNIGRACWPVDHYISDGVNRLSIYATSPSTLGPNHTNTSDIT